MFFQLMLDIFISASVNATDGCQNLFFVHAPMLIFLKMSVKTPPA